MDTQILLIGNFLFIMVVIGIWAGRGVRNIRGFALSKGFFSSFCLTATIVASFVGGGVVVGTAEKVFSSGVGYILGLMGFSMQLILTGLIIAPRMERYKHVLSIGDIVKEAYGKGAQVLTGFLWVMFCVGIVTAQISSLGRILSLFIDINPQLNLMVGAICVITYCYFGGIRAVVATDVIQFVVLMIAVPLALIMGVVYVGGIENVISRVPSTYLEPAYYITKVELVVLFLSFLLGDALIPPVMQRLLMARDGLQARRTMFWGGVITIPLCVISGLLGLVTYAIGPDVESTRVIPYLFATVLPVGIKALAVSGLIAVIMSSADSYLNSAAVVLTNDIMKPLARNGLGVKTELRLARMTTLVVGGVAVFMAFYVKHILDVLLHTYKFWGPTLVVPLIAIIVGKVIPRWGFYLAFGMGAMVAGGWDFVGLTALTKVSGLMPGLLANGIVFFIVYGCCMFKQTNPRLSDVTST